MSAEVALKHLISNASPLPLLHALAPLPTPFNILRKLSHPEPSTHELRTGLVCTPPSAAPDRQNGATTPNRRSWDPGEGVMPMAIPTIQEAMIALFPSIYPFHSP